MNKFNLLPEINLPKKLSGTTLWIQVLDEVWYSFGNYILWSPYLDRENHFTQRIKSILDSRGIVYA